MKMAKTDAVLLKYAKIKVDRNSIGAQKITHNYEPPPPPPPPHHHHHHHHHQRKKKRIRKHLHSREKWLYFLPMQNEQDFSKCQTERTGTSISAQKITPPPHGQSSKLYELIILCTTFLDLPSNEATGHPRWHNVDKRKN